MLEWVQVHQRLLNMQRLMTLSVRDGFSDAGLLAPIADLVTNSVSRARWKGLGELAGQERSVSEPLFRFKDGKPHPHAGETDISFGRAGYLRAPVRFRGNSGFFDPDEPANLILKLRALIGNNSRCGAIAYLLAHPEANPTEMADATGYFAKTIHNTMADMHLSGLVNMRTKGRTRLYSLNHAAWLSLLECDYLAGWIDWPRVFRALEILWVSWNNPLLSEETPENAGVHLALAEGKVLPMLRKAIPGSSLPKVLHGSPRSLPEDRLEAIRELVRILAPV